MSRLTGREAIEYAERHGLALAMYNSPVEDARDGLTVDEAREVAREDESLIYVDVDGYVPADDLVLCESPDGWSLHAPGSTDEQIAEGDAPYLVDGPWDEDENGDATRPSRADYARALEVLRERRI